MTTERKNQFREIALKYCDDSNIGIDKLATRIGLSESHLSALIDGYKNPDLQNVCRLASLTKLTLGQFKSCLQSSDTSCVYVIRKLKQYYDENSGNDDGKFCRYKISSINAMKLKLDILETSIREIAILSEDELTRKIAFKTMNKVRKV